MNNQERRFMVILDYHNTVADNASAKQALVKERFGIDIPPDQTSSERIVKHLTEDRYREMSYHVYEDVEYALRHVRPLPHAIETIHQFAREGIDVQIATASKERAAVVAQLWLRHYGLQQLADTLIQSENLKAICVRDYDAALENKPREAIAYKSVGIPYVCLLSNPTNQRFDAEQESIIRIEGYREFYRFVQSVRRVRSVRTPARKRSIA